MLSYVVLRRINMTEVSGIKYKCMLQSVNISLVVLPILCDSLGGYGLCYCTF